jgi:hypothetical protein
MTRTLRYNRSEATKREQSEAQKNRRPLSIALTCWLCLSDFVPRVGNQKRCPACIAAKRTA